MGRRRSTWVCRVAVVATAVALAGCLPGSVDRDFGVDGRVQVGELPGRVSLVGTHQGGVVATGDAGLVHVGVDGTVDAGWGAPYPVPCAGRDDLDHDARGRFVLACDRSGGDGLPVGEVVRFTRSGQLDTSFGDGGVARAPVPVGGLSVAPLPAPGHGYLGVGELAEVGTPDSVPTVAVVVFDRDGAVAASSQIALPTVPPGVPTIGSWRVSTLVVPAGAAAVAAVNVTFELVTGLPVGYCLVLRFDAQGVEIGRFDGPSPPADVGFSAITALTELPDGQLAAATHGEGLILNFPEATPVSSSSIVVYTPDGTALRAVAPTTPAGGRIDGSSLLATPQGRLVLGGGTSSPDGTTRTAVVARYDSATLELDARFGNHGVATVALRSVSDLARRSDGISQVYVGGLDDQSRPTVTRLWNMTT